MNQDQTPNGKKTVFKGPVLYFSVAVVAACTSVAIYAGAQFAYQRWAPKTQSQSVLDNPASAGTAHAVSSSEAVNQLKKTSESFRSVAKAVGPAVVNIKATKGGKKEKAKLKPRSRRGRPLPPQHPQEDPGEGDPFFDFFGPFFGQPFPPQDMPQQQSLGSGIIVDPKGIVVTNNHVVEGASEILVRLSGDKTELKAKVLGTDPRTDLAVLKLEGRKEFPSVGWGDSDSVEVGDWAVAIGSPFALDQSVTVGIISAKGRTGEVGLGQDFSGELLQTDAAINPGNSGGPLCDLEGKVIGINTAIYTRSGGYMGIGFAIPSNLVKEIVGKLVATGKVIRGWLGVMIQPLDEELGKELGVKEGVGVHEVLEGSPAESAGIKAGDVIIQVDDKDVKSVNELQRRIGNIKPGDTVKLKVVSYSDKKTRTVTVKIGELPNDDKQASASGAKEKDDEPDKLGLVVVPSKGGKDGLIIDGIQPGSFAEQFGLEVGDVIVKVNRQAVNNTAAYKKLISSAKRVYLEVKRKGRTLFFQFSLPE